ncbi:MAG: tRNA (N6-isopentenyl adenosine(37)-C2)-methylthiotransferase MiaB [Clostridia bacterium]|nr:tRNA (N6-isopentenyl adenosine(37)-C2)-methylthiotransferase MiaB [Clostridia bacterium]
MDNKSVNVSYEELERQRQYCDAVSQILQSKYHNGKPKAFVHTYGCQGNVSDGERMKGMLESMGYAFTERVEEADLVLYNTCAVREHAEDRIYGNAGALKPLKKQKPDMIIALCGCMMQQPRVEKRIRESFSFIDIVFGTHVIYKLPEILFKALSKGKRVFMTEESEGNIAEGLPVHRDSSFKAWLPIMYGCNNFCSYCIVPYVRGRERSRDFDAVVEEARQLVKAGYKEITLLGQNVNSYNRTLSEEYRFPALLRTINAIEGDFIIRFMTSHPKDCTEELLKAMSECDKVAKHLHLPFQSGNNRVLKAMNRGYTKEKYISLIEKAYELMPELSVTSDVIVGFPGETYEEFLDTLDVMKRVEYTSLFTFIFSLRPGTAAEKLPDPISREEKGIWFKELTDLQQEIAARRTSQMQGRQYRVLVEEKSKTEGVLCGRTEGNIIIEFPGDETDIGNFVTVEVTEALTWILRGKKI